MRISELSRRSEVPVATIKYYLREGLLHEGVRTAATQAQYDDTHLARLRLVRALTGPGGLSMARARTVLEAIDTPPEGVHELLGVAADAVARRTESDWDHERVHALLRGWGWLVEEEDCSSHRALAATFDALDAAAFTLPKDMLDLYATRMHEIAEAEIAGVPTGSVPEMVRYVVLGTVMVEPLLLALRRVAQQDASARRFGAATPEPGPEPSKLP